MTGWQDIATAPRDGTVVLSLWGGVPQFICWVASSGSVKVTGHLWWRRRVGRTTEGGWLVCVYSPRRREWLAAANFAPFAPTHWMPLPDAPTPSPSVTREGGE